jgi:hypothetical protein
VRLFLQINITDWKVTPYTKPLLGFASSLADDIVGTDLDCQSEGYVGDLVIKLISEADQIFVLVVSDSTPLPLGGSLSTFNALIKSKEKIHLAVLVGDHPVAEKMLMPFQENFVKQNDEDLIMKLIKQFAYC